MTVYMDLENLLKEKNISKNKVCEACNLQRTQKQSDQNRLLHLSKVV